MSRSNPDKAIAALIPEVIRTADGVDVRPLTLGTFALLERIKSPTLIACGTVDTLALIPSLYIMTHDPAKVYAEWNDLEAQALAWADTLPPEAIGRIEMAATLQIQRMIAVIAPEGDGKKSHNGWITSLVQWAAETYHWHLDYILWGVPAATVVLMRRQWLFSAGKVMMDLSEIEAIDNGEL